MVEVQRAFAAASEQGLVGERLLLEHVHPNLDGYFLLADAFYDALVARGLPGTPQAEVSEAEARAAMPVTEVDRYLGDYKTLRIKAGWPFSHDVPGAEPACAGQRGRAPRAGPVLRAHVVARGAGGAAGALPRSRRPRELRARHAGAGGCIPVRGPLQFDTAAALIQLGRPREAVRYSRRAMALESRNANHWLVHAHGLLLTGRKDEGRQALQTVLELEPGNPTARQVLQELGQE